MKKILSLIMIAVFIFAFTACTDENPVKVDDKTKETNADTNNDSNKETEKEDEFKVGDTFKMGSLQFTVKGFKFSEGDGEWNVPAEGKKYIYIDVTVENIGDEETTISSIMMFELYDMEGYAADIAFVTDAKGSLDGDLGGGRKMSGELVYEVPAEAVEFDFQVNPDFLGNGLAHVAIK